jgi:hypothetical protein
MSDLLDLVPEAHDGLDRWRLDLTGPVFAALGQGAIGAEPIITLDLADISVETENPSE